MLPDGDVVLFTARSQLMGDWTDARLVALSLSTGERRLVIEDAADGRYLPSGHLVFARRGTLMAAGFHAATLTVTGDPVTVVEDVMQAVNAGVAAEDTGAAQFGVSAFGDLAYVPGGIQPEVLRSLVWVDREGKVEPLAADRGAYWKPRLSPDGEQVAVYTRGLNGGVWIHDVLRGISQRLTTEGQNNQAPVWISEGDNIVFSSRREGQRGLFRKPADGSGESQLVTSVGEANTVGMPFPESWTEDGDVLAFTEGGDIWVLSLGEENPKPQPFVQGPSDEGYPAFSPDGRWLAYTSNESDEREVYVRPYPGPGAATRVSNDGGWAPAWAASGRELFYQASGQTLGSRMMAVDLSTEPTLQVGTPVMLFEKPDTVYANGRNYDVSTDGSRFLMVESDEGEEPAVRHINVVLNWLEELEERVQVN